MNTPNIYRDTFKNWVENSATDTDFANGLEIKDFYYADASRFIEAQRSKIEYPALILETPTYYYPPNFTGEFKVKLRGAYSVVKGCKVDDYPDQDDAMNLCLKIGIRVLNKIKASIKAQGAFFDNDTIIEPVLSIMTDNNYGYRFEFQLNNIFLSELSPCP